MAYKICNFQNLRPVKAVLFDMDGLILDTEKLYSRFWQEACIALGYPMTREQALTMRALNSKAGEENLRKFFGPSVVYQQVRGKRIQLMDAYIEKHGVEMKKGARELLDFLKQQDIPVALASSSPVDRIRAYLTPHGLFDAFPIICSGYEVAHGKPEPDIFLLAARKLGVLPENCMVLEDSPAGIQAAFAAGCMPVMVPDLDGPDEKTLSLLSALAGSLLDVIELIKRQ